MTAVVRLKALGARDILVVNMPDLGSSPEGLASGFSAQLTALTRAFNTALAVTFAVSGLDAELFDVFALMRRVIADPGDFGLTDVTTPCLDPVTFVVCADPDEHLFWDTTHPTTRAHGIVADRITGVIRKLARSPHGMP